MAGKKQSIKCPICGGKTSYFVEPIGPFCSMHCQNVDLGRWLGEDYRFSEPLRPEHFAPYEDLPGHADLDQPSED